MEGPVVPKQLNYSDVLPVAIESKSNKRTFEPTNGNTFGPTGNRIIRLNINSDNLCDFTHSFLQATLVNTTTTTGSHGDGAGRTDGKRRATSMALDYGVPWIKRLQILSGGQELEDINEYGRLYSMLASAQGNPEQNNEKGMNSGLLSNYGNKIVDGRQIAVLGGNTGGDAGKLSLASDTLKVADIVQTIAINQNTQNPYLHNGVKFENAWLHTSNIDATVKEQVTQFNDQVPSLLSNQFSKTATDEDYLVTDDVNADAANAAYVKGGAMKSQTEYTYNINLVSAILNNSKYWPLIFTNLGLDLYIHLEDAVNIGAYSRFVDTANVGTITPNYEIKNVRFHAHLVDVDRSFYDRMRMAMQQAGGVLQMSGTTFKHYLDTHVATSDTHMVQISTRVKSLNALLVRPQRQSLNNKLKHFCVSVGEGCNMNNFAFRVGSVQYPQRGVDLTDTNMGESYSEVRKVFGTLGTYDNNTYLNQLTFPRGYAGGFGSFTGANTDTTTQHNQLNNSASPGSPYSFFTAAYGFEGFAKTATESGINVSDRALPVICEIKRDVSDVMVLTDGFNSAKHNAAVDETHIRYDVFAMTDMIVYITADGAVSTRV